MDLAEKITSVLSPHLGANTADAVARHLCAKYGVAGDEVPEGKVAALQDTIRRGLVAFVGPERADELARRCFEAASG